MARAWWAKTKRKLVQVGDLTNLQLHSSLLSDGQMEAVTLCKEHIEGDMVLEISQLILLLPDKLDERKLLHCGKCEKGGGHSQLF